MTQSSGSSTPVSRRAYWFIGGAVLVAVLLWFFGRPWLEQLHDRVGEINGAVIVAALVVLPLVGFPVSVLHALTGAKFGWTVGLPLVAGSIAVQLVASYLIVHAAPDFFARRFASWRRRLPPTTHRALALFTLLLPGAPYFAQNYVLAVVGVPFRIFFFYALPLNVARSIIGIIFGEWSGQMTHGRMAVFGIYAVTVTLACALAFRRLRRQLHNQPAAAGDPKQSE